MAISYKKGSQQFLSVDQGPGLVYLFNCILYCILNSFSYVFHQNGFCIDCGARLLYLAHIGLVPQVRLPSSLLPQFALPSLLAHFTLPIATLRIAQYIATVYIAQSITTR